jgi:sarcosine oxidase, subunit gamma
MAEAVPVAFTTLASAARLAVRGSGEAVSVLGDAFGLALPQDACRATSNGSRAALWLGPDEWLLIAPDGEMPALGAWMADALGDTPASIVDVSDRNLAIEVKGSKAAEAINAFNPLDLHPDAFPVGMCTRTVLGKAEIVLWRTAAATFRIEVWRSFAPYVLGCLEEAAREYRT